MSDINKRLCELLGCDVPRPKDTCPLCGKTNTDGKFIDGADFFSEKGRIALLKRMENHPNGKLFFAQLIYAGDNVEAIDDDGLIARSYITDDTGALARAALEFLEAKA